MDSLGIGGIICASGCLIWFIGLATVAIIRAVKGTDNSDDYHI